jgi:hypothetical protein
VVYSSSNGFAHLDFDGESRFSVWSNSAEISESPPGIPSSATTIVTHIGAPAQTWRWAHRVWVELGGSGQRASGLQRSRTGFDTENSRCQYAFLLELEKEWTVEDKPPHGPVAGSHKSAGLKKSASATQRPSGKREPAASASKQARPHATHKKVFRPPERKSTDPTA